MYGSYLMAITGASGGSLSRPLNLGSGDLEVSREQVKVANLQLEAMLADLLEVSVMVGHFTISC